MAFDVGNGLSLMGGTVAKTAGDYLLANQKSELEDQSMRLADELATKRQVQQQGFQTQFEKETKQPFEREQTEKTLASHKEVAQIGKEGTMGAAGIAAGASREHSAALERIEAARAAADLEKTKLIWGTRSNIEDKKLAATAGKLDAAKLSEVSPGNDNDGKPLPDPLTKATDAYIDTGKFPLQSGFGSQAQKTQIQARLITRQQERGIDDGTMRSMWGTKQAAQKDLDNQVKMGGMIANYSQTLDKNIDAATKLITDGGKIDPAGSPLLNKWITATEKEIFGDPNLTVLDQQLKLVAVEAAKLNTGQLGVAGLPEGAREEYNKILNIAKTTGQLDGLFSLLKADANRRLTSQDEQIKQAQHTIQTGTYTPLADRNNTETPKPGAAAPTPGNKVETLPLPRDANGKIDTTKMRGGLQYFAPSGAPMTYHPETPDTPFWPVPGGR